LLLSISLAGNLQANIVEVGPEPGGVVAAINWTDETGRRRTLSEFAGYPIILLPIYTRCRGACVQDVSRLEKALADSNGNPRQFRVLLFSFDATDTAATLINYRRRENIPLAWSIATSSQQEIDALLDSIGIQVGKSGKEFIHPNVVIFLDANLRIAKWIYGTDYTNRDIDSALKVASGQNDWIGRHSEWIYSILLLATSILAVALCYYLLELRLRRRIALPEPAA
jgi:protein SCO1/2